MRDAVMLLLDRTPNRIDYPQLERELAETFTAIDEVEEVKVWEVAHAYAVATVKLRVPSLAWSESDSFRHQVTEHLINQHDIREVIVQLRP